MVILILGVILQYVVSASLSIHINSYGLIGDYDGIAVIGW